MAKIICYSNILHLTLLVSSHYRIKHNSAKFLDIA